MRREGTEIQGPEEKIAPTRQGEGGSKKKGEKRALAPLFNVSVPGPALCKLGRPGVLLVLPEVLTPVLRPSFVLFSSIFAGLSLPGLLATTILDSFSLF